MSILKSRFLCSLSVASLLIAVQTCRGASASSDPTKVGDELAVAIEGYLNNLGSFACFRCEFDLVPYKAASIEEAVSGRFRGTIGPALHGLWIVKSPWERYKLGCQSSILENAQKQLLDQGRSSPGVFKACLTEDSVSNGEVDCERGFLVPNANLQQTRRESQFLGSYYFDPLRPGCRSKSSLESTFQRCIRGELWSEFRGVEDVHGRKAMVFVFGQSPTRMENRVFLDPDRGFMPVRDELFHAGKPTPYMFTIVTDFRECTRGRWFPIRWLLFAPMDGPRGDRPPYDDVRELTVTSLQVEPVLADRDFEMEIPAGYQVSMQPENLSALVQVGEKPLIVTPSSMPQLRKELDESAKYWKAVAQSRMASNEGPRRLGVFGWLVLLHAIAVTAAAPFVCWRLIRKKAKEGRVESPQ